MAEALRQQQLRITSLDKLCSDRMKRTVKVEKEIREVAAQMEKPDSTTIVSSYQLRRWAVALGVPDEYSK